MQIDLRSDTITKPSPEMLAAMLTAKVGDDVFGEDLTVIELENKSALMFGFEAGLFCASGTMANQIAINCHTSPGGEVICHKNSHVYLYEGGGIAATSACSVKLLEGDYGILTAQSISQAINNPNDIHFAVSQLVSLENTMNKGGGTYYDFNEFVKIKEVCKTHNLKLHLDGARLFNALVASQDLPKAYGEVFDSVSICLSKGLGCPVGSVLLGSKIFIAQARRLRKRLGGGWRQAGFLAAAGIYALENNIERLADDHRRAKEIGKTLNSLSFVKNVYPIKTNIIIFELQDSVSGSNFVKEMALKGILGVTFGQNLVRFVTHLDFSDADLKSLKEQLLKIEI